MGRFWAIVFLLVPVLGTAVFFWAPAADLWLPRDVSKDGHAIDHLFYFILVLTGLVFVATEVVLFWFLWKYDGERAQEPAKFTHGSHTLEVVWTILPAATLLFIAIYQMNAWAETKMDVPDVRPLVEVTGRQFEWRLRYPRTPVVDEEGNATGEYSYGQDDLFLVNDLRVPVGETVKVDLKSMDVLHSFFLPNVRVKQDAVPGMSIPVWFQANEVGQYDLVCAELCGWGHYKMKGRLTVMPRDEWEAWIEQELKNQEAMK